MIIISAAVLFAMDSFSRNMIENNTERKVTQAVEEISRRFAGFGERVRPIRDFELYNQGVYMMIYDRDKNLINGMVPFGISDEFEFSNDSLRTTEYGGSRYYEYDREIHVPNGELFWIKGIVSISDELDAVGAAARNNIILSVILILIAAAGGYIIISRAFIPVEAIRKTAEEISESGDLSRRIGIGNGKDEIYALANTFDEMLGKLERSFNQEKQFTSDASHELRTPVSVILSECEYAEECAETIGDYKESMDSVKRQAGRMSKLISELLTISRMDKNTIQTNFEDVDLSELLSFVCDEQEEIHDKPAPLLRNIQPNVTADADRLLITRLFINLISNAYQYIGGGDKISVTLAEENGTVTFSVEDNGIGIAEENLPKIWDRFYQVDSSRTTDANNSMGLGLSMVKWIAECHGGTITVKSELGKGSVFTFSMPKTSKQH